MCLFITFSQFLPVEANIKISFITFYSAPLFQQLSAQQFLASILPLLVRLFCIQKFSHFSVLHYFQLTTLHEQLFSFCAVAQNEPYRVRNNVAPCLNVRANRQADATSIDCLPPRTTLTVVNSVPGKLRLSHFWRLRTLAYGLPKFFILNYGSRVIVSNLLTGHANKGYVCSAAGWIYHRQRSHVYKKAYYAFKCRLQWLRRQSHFRVRQLKNESVHFCNP